MFSTTHPLADVKHCWIDRGEHLPPLLRAPEVQHALSEAIAEDKLFCRYLQTNGLTPDVAHEFVFGGFLQFIAKYGFTSIPREAPAFRSGRDSGQVKRRDAVLLGGFRHIL